MDTYAVTIPELLPLVSQIQEVLVAPVINAGENLDTAHVTCANYQYKLRKDMAKMNPPLATSDEVVSAKFRKHQVESAHFDGATPFWAQQMQQETQQHMNLLLQLMALMALNHAQTQQQTAQLQVDIQQTQLQMGTMQEQLEWRMEIESQRSMNRSRRYNRDEIVPLIRLEDGTSPVDHGFFFPANEDELIDLDEDEADVLLHFYHLPEGGDIQEKRVRLKGHLALTL